MTLFRQFTLSRACSFVYKTAPLLKTPPGLQASLSVAATQRKSWRSVINPHHSAGCSTSANAQDRVSTSILKFCDAVTLCHSVKCFWLFDVSSVYLKHSHYLHLLSIKMCHKSLSKNHSQPKGVSRTQLQLLVVTTCNVYLVGCPWMAVLITASFPLERAWSWRNPSRTAWTRTRSRRPGLPALLPAQASSARRRLHLPRAIPFTREILRFSVWQPCSSIASFSVQWWYQAATLSIHLLCYKNDTGFFVKVDTTRAGVSPQIHALRMRSKRW